MESEGKMSELTQCNCCALKHLRMRAKKSGKKLRLKSDPAGTWSGGKAVYVDGERVAWFAEVSKTCVC